MAHNVKKGTYPVFGYPLVCYSPLGKYEQKQTHWQIMFKTAMKARKGYPNEIGELLGGYDEFTEKQLEILKNFTRGRLRGG